jgi:molybdopterin/thiamine biosynthesis adenylyltransferase
MTDPTAQLRELAKQTSGPIGSTLLTIETPALRDLASSLQIGQRDLQIAALEASIVPERYRRNLGTVGLDGQLALLRSTVGIVGVGGLGGWVAEGLARMGVGHLILIDSDTFEDNNLNRQLFCTEATLGLPKVEAARRRIEQVNSATRVVAHQTRVAHPDQMAALLRGSAVIVDALDSLPTRIELQRAAALLDVPLVHGAIAGYVGQVMTIYPGDPGLVGLYGSGPVPEHGIEEQWGNPSATPMMIAAWQIHEVVKVITARGQTLRRRMLFMDAETGSVDSLEI